MNGTMVKVIALVAVAAVVGGAAVVLLSNGGNGNSSEDLSNIKSSLAIYGNANNDYTIDNSDVDLIESLKGKDAAEWKDNPLADVDGDGEISDKDVDLAKKIVNRDPMTLRVVTYGHDKNKTVQNIQYPLTNFVPFGTNIIGPLLNAGLADKCVGYFYCSYDITWRDIQGATDLKGPARQIDDTCWKNFQTLDQTTHVGALVVDASTAVDASGISDSRKADIDSAGIPELRYPVADAYQEATAVLTISYLFGGDYEKKGVSYAKITYDIMDEINAKIDAMPASEKKSYIAFTMGCYVCETDSTFNQTPKYVGAIPFSDVNADFKSKYTGTGSVKMSSAETLANYDAVDILLSNRSMDFTETGKTYNDTIIEAWEKYMSYYQSLDSYHDLHYVNNILPGGLRLAYTANAFYPELFSTSWADSYLEKCMSSMDTFKGISRDRIVTAFGYEDYLKATGNYTAKMMAGNFADGYHGDFGTMTLMNTSKDNIAIAGHETGSTRLPYSGVLYETGVDANSVYNAKKALIDEKTESLMGGDKIVLNNIGGFEKITAIKYNVPMGSTFTLVYFVGLANNSTVVSSVVDENGDSMSLYYSGAYATDDEIKDVFKYISEAVILGNEKYVPAPETPENVGGAALVAKNVADGIDAIWGSWQVVDGFTADVASITDGSHTVTFQKISGAAEGATLLGGVNDAINGKNGTQTTEFSGFKGINAKDNFSSKMGQTFIYMAGYTDDIFMKTFAADNTSSPSYFATAGDAADEKVVALYTLLAEKMAVSPAVVGGAAAVANAIATDFPAGFGTWELKDGYSSSVAEITDGTHRMIVTKIADNAEGAAKLTAATSGLDGKASSAINTYKTYEGYDGIYAIEKTVMSKTALYIAAYTGGYYIELVKDADGTTLSLISAAGVVDSSKVSGVIGYLAIKMGATPTPKLVGGAAATAAEVVANFPSAFGSWTVQNGFNADVAKIDDGTHTMIITAIADADEGAAKLTAATPGLDGKASGAIHTYKTYAGYTGIYAVEKTVMSKTAVYIAAYTDSYFIEMVKKTDETALSLISANGVVESSVVEGLLTYLATKLA